MAVTSEQYQPTRLSRQPGGSAAAPEAAAGADTDTLAAGAPPCTVRKGDPRRVGVVLVHGIGTQKPSETFLDWTRPVVQLLSDWRVEHGFSPDPVRVSEFSFSGAALPDLELDVPAFAGRDARTWMVTEAWWAAQVRPPSIGDVAAYLRDGLGRILRGSGSGQEQREREWRERKDQEVATRSGGGELARGDLEGSPAEVDQQIRLIARSLRPSRWWGWIDGLDWVQKWLTFVALGPAFVFGTVLLLVYAPFRAVPIKAIRDLAILRAADNFLTEWFGDLPTLLDDPVQAANVRSRTIEAIDGLVAQGCGRIVLVAHSGGAIVSFTTLVDPAYTDRCVDKLITIGEGLGLAWHLEHRDRLLIPGSRLAGDIRDKRSEMLWYDFWASYDPAPGGPLVHPLDLPLPVDSRPITNRMSIFEDHGAYWENDEGFLIPLIRHLDAPAGRPEDASAGSRFFPDRGHRTVLIERRRQRVAVLALWRWSAVVAAAVPIILGTLLAPPDGGPAALGRSATAFVGTIPGHQLITAPLDWLAGLVGGPSSLVGVGEWLLGSLLIAALFTLLALVGIRGWSRWDRAERAIAHRSVLQPVDRRRAAWGSLATLLVTVGLSTFVLRSLLA